MCAEACRSEAIGSVCINEDELRKGQMGRGSSRAAGTVGRMAGWFGRCGAGRSALPLVCGIVVCAAIAATSLPAFAQVTTPGSNAATSTQLNVVTGTIDGGGGPGYFVTQGATLVVNNGSLQN